MTKADIVNEISKESGIEKTIANWKRAVERSKNWNLPQ